MMVVVMYRFEVGKLEIVFDIIEFVEDLKLLLLINVFYDKKFVFNCF